MTPRQGVTHHTRQARRRKETLKRAGIWAFLIIFAFSVVGGALVAVGGFGQ
jgi:small neutral amino acid transporter SnatA (MarC family)